jgi:hypothetical protein
MKYAAFASLATIGYAQTATLSTIDVFGKTISSQSVEYEAGSTFTTMVDLGVATWGLRELRLNTGAYSVNECRFLMKPMTKDHKHEKMAAEPIEVGHFHDFCEWPNAISDDKFAATELILNTENIPQFYNDVHLWVQCDSQDVTMKAQAKTLPCAINKPETVENNQIENWTKSFYFTPLFENEKTFSMESTAIYLFNLADIFLGGLNPALDVVLKAGNLCVYKKSALKLFQANGIVPFKPMLMNHEAGHEVSQEEIMMMVHGVIKFGESIYGVETFAKAYPFYHAFKNGGLNAINDMVFVKPNYETTDFYKTVSAGKSFNPEFYQDVRFYFYLHAAALETVALVMQAKWRPTDIIQWWPRTLASYWDLSQAFLMDSA